MVVLAGRQLTCNCRARCKCAHLNVSELCNVIPILVQQIVFFLRQFRQMTESDFILGQIGGTVDVQDCVCYQCVLVKCNSSDEYSCLKLTCENDKMTAKSMQRLWVLQFDRRLEACTRQNEYYRFRTVSWR